MDFLKVAGKEIKDIFRNKIIRVSLIALLGLPILYSLVYLSAFWDPYGKMESFPVALVNLDKGASVNGEEVNLGEEMVDKFKEGKEMDWHFTNENEADEGLEGKKYYVKVLIPEDFSERVVSAQEGKPKVANLKITTNPKKNYIGAQIGSSIEGKIKENITAKISETTVSKSFDILFDLKDGLVTAVDGSSKLHDGVGILNENIPTMSNLLGALGNGSSGLLDGQNKLNAGILQVSGGLKEVNGNIPMLNEGVDKLDVGSSGLKNGLQLASGGANQLSNGSEKIYGLFKENVYPAVYKLKVGANRLSKSLESASVQENKSNLSSIIDSIKDGGNKISKSSSDILNGYEEVKNVVDTLNKTSNSNSKIIESLESDIQKALESEDKASIESALKKVKILKSENKINSEKIKELQKEISNVNSILKEHNSGVQSLTQNIDRYASNGSESSGDISELSKGINQLSNGLDSLEKGLNENNQESFGRGLKLISQNMSNLNARLGQLNSGAEQLNSGVGQLSSSVGPLQNSIGGLSNGSSKLIEGSETLLVGQEKIASGLKGMNDNIILKLGSGVGDLYNASKELSEKLGEGATEIELGLKNPSSVMALGLEPTNVLMFFLVLIVTSLVFLSIIYFLLSSFGQVGNLLVMILLIFQLVGSEGTFPLELQPPFINAINPFLPFTYVLEALREVISATTINYSVIGKDLLVLGAMGLIFLTLSVVFKKSDRGVPYINESNEVAQM